jgi:hypothetical protein
MLFKYRTSFCLCVFAVQAGHTAFALNIDPKAEIHPTAILMGNVTCRSSATICLPWKKKL